MGTGARGICGSWSGLKHQLLIRFSNIKYLFHLMM
jgi:hypothetical protein